MPNRKKLSSLAALLLGACSQSCLLEEKQAGLPLVSGPSKPYHLATFGPENSEQERTYKGIRAREIASRLIPPWSEKITRVDLREHQLVYGGKYSSFSIYFSLEPELSNDFLCESTTISYYYKFSGVASYGKEIHLKIVDGNILGYAPVSVQELKRTTPLRRTPFTNEAIVKKCRDLAGSALRPPIEGSGEIEGSAEKFGRLERSIANLENELSGGRRKIVCLDKDGKPSALSRQAILAMIRANPPQREESISLPGREDWATFRFSKDTERVVSGYSIAMSWPRTGEGEIWLKLIDQPILETMP